MTVEIRVLRYFVESAKEQNMTKAAERLHVTQPTLSRQLRDLEDELGQKLFVRSNYSIHLTPEGRILYQRAMDILDMVDKTAAEFQSMNDFNGGEIYIGCAESEGITYVARAAKALQKQHPNIRFHLYSGNAERVIERLDKGLLDLAVIVQNIDVSKYASLDVPYTDIWGLIMRKDSPLATLEAIPLTDLLQLPLIVSRQGPTTEMPDWFRDHYDRFNIVGTYDLLYNAAILVKERLGYALGFDRLVNTGSDSILCFRPLTPAVKSPMRIIWNRKQEFSRAAKLLLQELKQLSADDSK